MPQKPAPGSIQGKGDRNLAKFKKDEREMKVAWESSIMPRPDQFEPLFKEARDSEELTAQVTAQIADVIRNSGAFEEDEIDSVADSVFELIDVFGAQYKSKTMHESVTFLYNSVFDELNVGERDIKTVMLEAQKITDVLFKNYPPVSTSNGALDRYANNYFVSDKRLVKTHLLMNGVDLSDEQLESFSIEIMGKARFDRALNTPVPVKKEEPEEIANTSEAEMSEPMRAQIVIPELSEKVGDQNLSGRVEEKDALAKNNVRE